MRTDIPQLQRQGQELQARLARLRTDLAAKTADLDGQIATGAPDEMQIITAREIASMRTVEAATINGLAANDAKLKAAQEYDASPEGQAKRKQAQELDKKCAQDDAAIAEAINNLYAVAAAALANARELHKLGGHHDTTLTEVAWRRADELMRDKSLIANAKAANTPAAREHERQLDEQARELRAKKLAGLRKAAA